MFHSWHQSVSISILWGKTDKSSNEALNYCKIDDFKALSLGIRKIFRVRFKCKNVWKRKNAGSKMYKINNNTHEKKLLDSD